MMRLAPLIYYDIKRLCRCKPVLIALFALPVFVAFLRVCFSEVHAIQLAVWFCLIVCAILTCLVVYVRWSVDKASGFYEGLRSTPLSDTDIVLARVIFGAIILALQVAILLGIILLVC